MTELRLLVPALSKETASRFEAAVLGVPRVASVDSWPGRAHVHCAGAAAADAVLQILAAAGFSATTDPGSARDRRKTVRIEGMTCKSCEIMVERRLRKIPGVESVDVDSSSGIATIGTREGAIVTLAALGEAVAKDGYRIASRPGEGRAPRSMLRLFGVFSFAAAILILLSKVSPTFVDMTEPTSFAAAAILGLVAGSSACMAVSGGLMLSVVAEYAARGTGGRAARLAPAGLFVGGRIASYAALGGAIGLMGNALTLTPATTGILTIAAALFMIITGLDLLGLAPSWMRVLIPRAPKRWGNAVMNGRKRRGALTPLLMGAGTFFIPCGYTQALQLVALASGSAATGAAILGGFAVGTAPALMALGFASTAFGGKYGKLALQLVGAIVLILGLSNIRNGFVAAGIPISVPWTVQAVVREDRDPNVKVVDGVQVIRMKIGIDPAYSPSDRYTVTAGMPVRFEISGVGTGCRSIFQIPKYGVRSELSRSLNVVEFTPEQSGDAVFSCSMGMFPGMLRVLPRS